MLLPNVLVGSAKSLPLFFGLQGCGLLANNLFLLWELPIAPLCLGCVFFALFDFVCFTRLVPHA